MGNPSPTLPIERTTDPAFERDLRQMNEALLVSSVHQHELAEQAQKSDAVARSSEERLRRTHIELLAHSQELARFNRVAVERESRIIELKIENNELRQRYGEAARFPLQFERGNALSNVMPAFDAFPSSEIQVPLESILCTDELNRRPARQPDYETENVALVELARALANSPQTILQTLVDKTLEILKAGSAGLSVLSIDETRFFWPAIAGKWQPHIGEGTPRDFGPCGDVLDRDTPLLFSHIERRYPYFLAVTPPVEECLLVPFYVDGKAVGTIWAVAHEAPPEGRSFDAEDLRQLESLGRFASAAYQSADSCGALDQRRAALSLMEDAVEARQATEKLNVELNESEIRYRRLFESAKDGILILDASNGTIIDVNSFMSDLLGRSHDELIGKELWEIGLFTDRSASEASLRELREKNYLHHDHLHLETKDRLPVDAEMIANVYRSEDQSVIQCNIRDITERSRLERKTHEQAEALTDLHRRKDEFLAMLSHELRNPLAPILNAVQLLGFRKDKDPIQQRATGIIERQVGQLTRLVDDLMEVSRINTGRIHLHLERVALNGILERSVESTRPFLGQCRHTLEVSLPPQPIWVEGDAARLEQVVVNLLTNAAKYTEEGGQIWLSVEQEGDEAVLRLRDTGVGIAPELLPRIFDLFTQAERSLDRSQGGLGIGLSLVQRLVEMHQGTVEVHSVLGQGSEFIVRLPTVASYGLHPPSTVAETAPPSDSIRVLVVDDNEDAALALSMLLDAAGHVVQTAHDGTTAFQAALEFRPDVVLLDIGLPGRDGYEVAKQLRQQSGHKKLVLVALTGYGQEADRQRSLEAGFDHHLVKPADFGKLQEILNAALESSKCRDVNG